MAGARRAVQERGRLGTQRAGSRSRHRSSDRRAAAHQATGRFITGGGGLRPPAGLGGGGARARTRRECCRRCHRGLVRARRRGTRCVRNRRRRDGGAVSERHVRARGRRLQGPDARAGDDRQRAHLSGRAAGRRWSGGGEHSRGRRRNGPAVPAIRERAREVGRPRRAGDPSRGGRVRAGFSASDEPRGRPRLSGEVSRGGADLSGWRQGAACGRAVRQPRLRRDAARDRGRQLRVLSRRDREADRGRHGGERRDPDLRGPGPVPRDRARAALGPVPRSRRVLRAAAGLVRRVAHRDAADPRSVQAAEPARVTRRTPTTCIT